MMTVKLITHALIKNDGKYLVIQRTDIKRGKDNVYPSYWDISGGSVEEGETPREGAFTLRFAKILSAGTPTPTSFA